MTLADLIRKKQLGGVAGAIPAIQQGKGTGAIVNPPEAKTGNFPEAAIDTPLDPTKPHWAWRLTYPDGTTKEQFTLPEATHAEIAKLWPEVIGAEPFNPIKSQARVCVTLRAEAPTGLEPSGGNPTRSDLAPQPVRVPTTGEPTMNGRT